MAIMFVYKGKALPDYEATTKAVLNCMNRISKA